MRRYGAPPTEEKMMAIDEHGNGVAYLRTVDSVAEYEVKIGGVRMLVASVDEKDPFLKIRVRGPKNWMHDHVTRFRAEMKLYSYGEGDDLRVEEHVSPSSVHATVLPALPWLLALVRMTTTERLALDSVFQILHHEPKE